MKHSTICVDGLEVTSFWHCFGSPGHHASMETVVALLQSSRTNVLPINTHNLDTGRKRQNLELGFAGVAYDALCQALDVSKYVKMLNINHRTSATAAVEAAKASFDMTLEPVLKLEVLDAGFSKSQDDEVLAAAKSLLGWNPDLKIFPLLSCNLESAQEAIEIGCGLLRIMGSDIGSRRGITDPDAFEGVCQLPVPVLLDGGIGHPHDVSRAANLGASGVLVNRALFEEERRPQEVVAEYSRCALEAFAQIDPAEQGV